jgi:glycosyltransferase involved in cell wall biosynthesis
MKVTIGIPVYNCEAWVREAIDSALAQTWPRKEVIVVDDGSQDRTPAICAEFGQLIRYVRQDRRGGNSARNLILKLATGDWIQYLDADDYLIPDKIQSQLTALSDEIADLILSPTISETWRDGSPIDQAVQEFKAPFDWYRYWIAWKLPQTGGCLWRKEFLQTIGGWNEELACNQDYELYLRALQAEAHIRYVETPGAVYRLWSDGTVSRKDKTTVILGRTALIKQFLKWLEQKGRASPRYRREAAITCFESARTLATQDLAVATRYYLERKSEGLIEMARSAAPGRYSLMAGLLGFRAAERIAAWNRKRESVSRRIVA